MTREHPFTHFPCVLHEPNLWRLMRLPVDHSEWEMHLIRALILFILYSEIALPFIFKPTLAQTVYIIPSLYYVATHRHEAVCTPVYLKHNKIS
jgi:hypothetical protein